VPWRQRHVDPAVAGCFTRQDIGIVRDEGKILRLPDRQPLDAAGSTTVE
jgi:hypothetical protein